MPFSVSLIEFFYRKFIRNSNLFNFSKPKRIKIMNKFEELKNLVMSLEADFAKFYEKNNQTAGTRIRKGMQDLKMMAQNIRVEVQEIKNKEEAKKK